MHWIFLAVGAQFLNAIVAVIDKRIVSDEKILPKPFVYAFYTCLISGAWIIIYFVSLVPLPFDGMHIPSFANISRPTLEIIALSFLAAYAFFMALVSMFTAFQQADASDVVPVIGATSAIASFGLGYFFLHGAMSPNFLLGIILLAVGTFLVSRFHFTPKTAMLAIHAGIFFAFHYVALKGLFLITSFDDAFFWSRICFMLYALSLLLVPTYYRKIMDQTKSTSPKAGIIILINKLIAGISTILILKATDMGDVAVVQAIGGLQFVFILMFGIFFTLGPVAKLKGCDDCPKESILQKSIFVSVIVLGFLVLFK